jgi:hypothetical protein
VARQYQGNIKLPASRCVIDCRWQVDAKSNRTKRLADGDYFSAAVNVGRDGSHVKLFTNFSCEAGGQLLKHRLDFEVSQTTFKS